MYMWRELGVNSWPSFVIVGPTGKILAQLSGEGHRKVYPIPPHIHARTHALKSIAGMF